MMLVGPQISSMPPSLPRGLRRALDAMRVNVERDWHVIELAAVAGVSGRTLQRQFRSCLGQTPRAALRDVRFERARRELLQGLPGAKVTDIALRSGLPHCGRFSIEYRRRYGETPSQTLSRQAKFVGALASMPAMITAGHDRATVAVCPIEAGSENSEIARSLADEIATALTRSGVAVTTQRSATYHLTGTIRGSGQQTYLTLRLIECESGYHLWAHRCSGVFEDYDGGDAHFATRIVGALQSYLRLAEIGRARRKPEADVTPHDLTLRAIPGVLSLDADGNARALDLLDRATDRNPDHALAIALAAWAHVQRVVYHFTATPFVERARSADLVRKARALGGDATVLAVLGNALTLLHDLDTANLVIRKALSVDAGCAWAWSRSGWIDVYQGDAQSAIERFMIALDLAPHDSLAFNNMVGIGCAHFLAGRYLDAARWQERALIEHPSAIWVHRTLCPAYALGGAGSDARRSLAALREQYPDLTVSDVQRHLPPLPHSFCDRVLDALHTVGLPL